MGKLSKRAKKAERPLSDDEHVTDRDWMDKEMDGAYAEGTTMTIGGKKVRVDNLPDPFKAPAKRAKKPKGAAPG